jgi:hypothetical protein
MTIEKTSPLSWFKNRRKRQLRRELILSNQFNIVVDKLAYINRVNIENIVDYIENGTLFQNPNKENKLSDDY